MTQSAPAKGAAAGILNSSSVRVRFIVSILSNGSRAVLSFVSGMLVARVLKPSAYGDLAFLLGSFVAFQTLLDMGMSNAFFTLISQQPRPRKFYLTYFAWQGLQFLVSASFVSLLCPSALLNVIWLGHSRGLVMLAFVAAFAQQQLWQAISQIGEGARQSVRVQIMNLSIALAHLTLVVACIRFGCLSIPLVYWLMIIEYGAAILLSYWFLRQSNTGANEVPVASLSTMLKEYWVYCKPLALLSVITFSYFFADRWLLQRFGGGAQQGFYQVSAQFAGVALLATTSILRIFWKEIAEANARQDQARVERMHRKVFRGLVMVSASFSCFFIPWSGTIVVLLLGESYAKAGPVLAIMFLYPILQTMGQVNGTTLLASGHTREYAAVSSIFLIISIPVTFLVQAPTNAAPIHGLGGGALGMAIKMVALGFLSINAQAWILARKKQWSFEWAFPLVVIGITLALGYAARGIVALFWRMSSTTHLSQLQPFLGCLCLYAAGLLALIWNFPAVVGMKQSEVYQVVNVMLGRRTLIDSVHRQGGC
jgi:O-antigen/teichoic acid export membrane protein